jgi:hypothetical protein
LHRGKKEKKKSVISPFFLFIALLEMIKDTGLEEGFQPPVWVIPQVQSWPGIFRRIANFQFMGVSVEL